MNKIIYNLESNTIEEKIINQPLIMGQKKFYNFEFIFRNNNNEILYNPDWRVSVVFERPDAERTNNLPILLTKNKYIKQITPWISDVAGELKISVYIRDNNGNIIQAVPITSIEVRAGITPSGNTITDAQYQDIINIISDINRTTFVERDVDIINYEMEYYQDVTYINPVNYGEIIIPDNVKHGFYHGVNFVAGMDVDINVVNNSNYPLKIFKHSREYHNLLIKGGSKVNMAFYCDGINVNCHYVIS